MIKQIVAIYFIVALTQLFAQVDTTISSIGHINGVSYVSAYKKLDSVDITSVKAVGAEWVSIVPFAYMNSGKLPEIKYDEDWFYYGDRLLGVREMVSLAKSEGLKVLVKPQVWVEESFYTGKIWMKRERHWRKLESAYSEYILAYAKVAEEEQADMFCIGTEMRKFVNERPKFWANLIGAVRNEFSGKLTYAANWDDYDQVPFWKHLDYVGIDAYFPISKDKHASVEALKTGWKPIVSEMDSIAKLHDKKIILTEYGYRSIKGCAIRPWDYKRKGECDELAQANALQALYEVVWNHEQFLGGFLWKWHPEHKTAGGSDNTMFTVQNKMSEKVVEKYYKTPKKISD